MSEISIQDFESCSKLINCLITLKTEKIIRLEIKKRLKS